MTRRLKYVMLASLATASCKHSAPTEHAKGTGPVDMTAEVVTVAGKVGELPPNPDALPLWSEVKKGVLPNGLTYYILPHAKPEKRAFLWLAVNAGSTSEDDDQRGLAHFDEHMAFNGTKRFPKSEIVNYLESIGMRFGADLNAYTDFDETVYQLEVPTDDAKFVDKGLDILHDWATDASYDPVEVDKERGVVLEEWRLGRGAGARLFDKQVPVIYAGTRYADRLTIGLPDTLKTAKRDTLYRFYKDWYRPDNMAVIAVGDFDPATIEKTISAKFGDIAKPAKERTKVGAGVPKPSGTRISIETDHEATGQGVTIQNLIAHRPEESAKDLARSVTEQVYTSILAERFATLARKADAPFTGAFGDISNEPREIDSFERAANVKNGKVEDCVRALFTEVVRLEKFGVTQTELDRVRTNMARNYEAAVAREATVNSRSFASEITRNYFKRELMIGAKKESELSLAVLPTITVDRLNQIGKAFGGAENRVIVLTGPEGKPLPTKERILAIIDEVGKADIKAWEDKVATEPLMKDPPKPGKVVTETKNEKIGTTEWKLSNGARVIVKPTDFEADSVSMQAFSPGGSAMVSDKDYTDARFATIVADVGGLGNFDRETLQKMLSGKRASAQTIISETFEGLFASASPKDLETMFQLAYLGFTAPRKDAEQIEVWRANSAERLTNQLVSPEVQFGRQTTDAMFKGNVRRRPLDPDDYKKVNADKALAFYKDRFADASDFTFVVVGDVDLAKLKPLVETYLASLPTTKRKVRDIEKDLGIKRVAGVVKKEVRIGEEPKARVQLTFHGDEKWTRDNERDMALFGRVLSIKLREVLREDKGGVYGVSANGNIARAPRHERTFSVSFGCAPDRVDELVAATFDEIAKLAKDGTDEDHLAKVRATYLRERETSLKTNGAWVGWLVESARYNDDPTLILDPAPAIARMTNDNVKAAAKKYADKKQYFTAVLLPKK